MVDNGIPHRDVIDEISRHLSTGTSVNLVGLRASGRSTIVRHVVEKLAGRGTGAVQIAGVRSLDDRPLAALVVAGVLSPSSPHTLHMLGEALDELQERLSSGPSVLVVDDADDLDLATVGAIEAIHIRLHVPVFTTTRPGKLRPDRTAPLARLLPGVRTEVTALSFAEVRTLVHDLLTGPVEPSAVARIATASGGLPGLVKAIVSTARAGSRLVPRDGLWVARGDLWTSQLAQTIEPYVDELDEAQRAALSWVASAGAVELSDALAEVSPHVLDALDDSRLLEVTGTPDEPVLNVFPQLVAELLVAGSTAPRLDDKHPSTGGLSLRLAVPAPVARIQLGWTSVSVLHRLVARHQDDTLRARSDAWVADRSARTTAPLVDALLRSGALPHEVDTVLARSSLSNDDPRALAILTVHQVADLVRRHDQLESARELVNDRRGWLREFDGLLRAADQIGRAHV